MPAVLKPTFRPAALIAAALRGVAVTLVMPKRVDGILVGAAARSHYRDLLQAGVRIKASTGAYLLAHARDMKDILIRTGIQPGVCPNAKNRARRRASPTAGENPARPNIATGANSRRRSGSHSCCRRCP